ncbi:uncharacterized protein LOC132703879 [Cylas formicarius]|uniref:uncharacterized protein LOC132703879 n=1 Tax=Cylas formicarius TaxID=197179 RepID=UPI002958BDE5|nr:uncharacterized protein LOC132703879 [Cylas formicarius]
MMPEDTVNVLNFKYQIPMRRSSSTSDLNNRSRLNSSDLRATRSSAEASGAAHSEFFLQKIREMDLNDHVPGGIETRDLLTNEPVLVKEEALNYQGKIYSRNDIAYFWKKDCRMWLWKNCKEFKKNRSVAERRIQLIKDAEEKRT